MVAEEANLLTVGVALEHLDLVAGHEDVKHGLADLRCAERRVHVVDEIHVVAHYVLDEVDLAWEALDIEHSTMVVHVGVPFSVRINRHVSYRGPVVVVLDDTDVRYSLALVQILED